MNETVRKDSSPESHRARAVAQREGVTRGITRSIRDAVSRLGRLRAQRGVLATLRFVLTRLLRYEVHWIYAMEPDRRSVPLSLKATETLTIIDSHNLDSALNPKLEEFLGGRMAFENLSGVREGDLLFVVSEDERYVHRGYALFKTRNRKLLCERDSTPIIGYCYSAAAYRGRGIYRRALAAESDYLLGRGFERIVIETEPENVASQKGILAAGFEFAREVRAVIVLNNLFISLTKDSTGRKLQVFLK